MKKQIIKWSIAALILILAFVLRMEFFKQTEYNPFIIKGDSYHYLLYGLNLRRYHIFSKQDKPPIQPDSFWSPGYPALIAGFAYLFADRPGSFPYKKFIILQSLMGALVVLFTLLIGQKFLSDIPAFLAALLVATSPHLISINALLLTENLFTLLLLGNLLLIIQFIENKKTIYLLLSGLLFSLTYLVNAVVFFLPFFIAIYLYYIGRRRHLILFLSLFLVAPIAWSIRNHLNVPPEAPNASDRLLTNLIIGAHSDYYTIYLNNPRDPNNPADLDREKYKDILPFVKVLWQRIQSEPMHYLQWYFWQKPLLLWGWDVKTSRQQAIYIYPVKRSLYDKNRWAAYSYQIHQKTFRLQVLFAVLSLWFILRYRKNIPILLYLTVAYISAVYIVTQSEGRYSIPLRPEMYLLFMYFWDRIYQEWRRKRAE